MIIGFEIRMAADMLMRLAFDALFQSFCKNFYSLGKYYLDTWTPVTVSPYYCLFVCLVGSVFADFYIFTFLYIGLDVTLSAICFCSLYGVVTVNPYKKKSFWWSANSSSLIEALTVSIFFFVNYISIFELYLIYYSIYVYVEKQK